MLSTYSICLQFFEWNFSTLSFPWLLTYIMLLPIIFELFFKNGSVLFLGASFNQLFSVYMHGELMICIVILLLFFQYALKY